MTGDTPYTITVQPGKLLRIEEFAQVPKEDGYIWELDEGRVVRTPLRGPQHDAVLANLVTAFHRFDPDQHLGNVTLSTVGYGGPFREGTTVRFPSMAWVRAENVPALRAASEQNEYPWLIPDIAVEIASPWHLKSDITKRAQIWQHKGTPLVWTILPDKQDVVVWTHRIISPHRPLDGILDGDDVLPTFSVLLSNLFNQSTPAQR